MERATQTVMMVGFFAVGMIAVIAGVSAWSVPAAAIVFGTFCLGLSAIPFLRG